MISVINSLNKQTNISFGRSQQKKPSRPDVKVGIIDKFNNKFVDINGDNCPDLSHGQFVEYILKSNLNFKPTIRKFKLKEIGDGKKVSGKSFVKQLKKLTAAKEIQYANISIDNQITIGDLKKAYVNYLNENELEKLPVNELNSDNISDHRENLFEMGMNKFYKLSKSMLIILEKLARTKKIFVPAGKDNEHINLLNLPKGVINVGSVDEKFKLSSDSTDNSLVSVFAKGEYDVMPVEEEGTIIGYDITKDGIMDIPISEITGHEIIEQFVGKNIENVKATDKDYDRLKKFIEDYDTQDTANQERTYLSSKLFSMDALYSNKLKDYYTDFNSILDLEDNMKLISKNGKAKTPILMFKTTKDGKVAYNNPLEKNKPIVTLTGTSYAAPTALAQHLNEEYGYLTK